MAIEEVNTRNVDSGLVCPRCGAVVDNHEMGVTVPGQRLPVDWVLASRRCRGGCTWIGDRFRTPLRGQDTSPLPQPRPAP
jgi:hypothetical protein